MGYAAHGARGNAWGSHECGTKTPWQCGTKTPPRQCGSVARRYRGAIRVPRHVGRSAAAHCVKINRARALGRWEKVHVVHTPKHRSDAHLSLNMGLSTWKILCPPHILPTSER